MDNLNSSGINCFLETSIDDSNEADNVGSDGLYDEALDPEDPQPESSSGVEFDEFLFMTEDDHEPSESDSEDERVDRLIHMDDRALLDISSGSGEEYLSSSTSEEEEIIVVKRRKRRRLINSTLLLQPWAQRPSSPLALPHLQPPQQLKPTPPQQQQLNLPTTKLLLTSALELLPTQQQPSPPPQIQLTTPPQIQLTTPPQVQLTTPPQVQLTPPPQILLTSTQHQPSPQPQQPTPHTISWVRTYPGEVQRDVKRRFKVKDVGPREIGDSKTPMDFFNLFFPITMWQMMVRATNKFAQSNIQRMRKRGEYGPCSRFQYWKDVTLEDMRKFIGLVLNMGLVGMNNLAHYWTKKSNRFQPIFHSTMPFSKFQLIMSQFQVSSRTCFPRGHANYDPLAKVRDFINGFNDTFKRHFVPSQEICIDESMIGMKNRHLFIQYMPNKRHSRFGMKKFELCDSASGYVIHVAFYSGNDFLSGTNDPFTHKVINELMEHTGLIDKWYHLFIDNFYTKISLANYLYQRKTFLTGTINKNSHLLSHAIQNGSLGVGETMYFRRGHVLLVKYKGNKNRKPVHLLTTAYAAVDTEIVSKSGARSVKPVVIHHYYQHMGGVDRKDKNTYNLTCSRRTTKYWKKIVYNFIDMALFNAYHLYRLNTNKPVSKDSFIDEIVLGLVSEKPDPVVPTVLPSRTLAGIPTREHTLQRLSNTTKSMMKCGVCGKRALFWCPGCNVGVHEKCFPQLQHFLRRPHPSQKRIPGLQN